MNKIALFVSKYSEENFLLAKHMCSSQESSCAFFFNCQKGSFAESDYQNTITRSEDEFSRKAFATDLPHLDEDLAVKLYSFIQSLSVQPDLIIFKGSVAESLPIASIREFSGLDIPTFCLLEDVRPEYSSQEICVLQNFDSLMLMDDVESNIEEYCKTRVIFPGFLASKIKNFKDLNSLMVLPEIDESIVFTNNENYKKTCFDVNKSGLNFNICSYQGMSETDLLIMIMLNSQIFDLTENEYFSIIVSKMGKKVQGPKVKADENKKNLKRTEGSSAQWKDHFKDFLGYIEKEIYHDLKNHLKEPVVIKANTVAM